MHKTTEERDNGFSFLPGSSDPLSPARRAVQTVIPFPTPSHRTAAPGWDDASSLDDDVYELGELAVRLVADWSLPRLQVFVAADPEEGEPDRLP